MKVKYPPPPLASEPLYRNAVLFDTPKPLPAPEPSLVEAWKRHVQARFLLDEPPADSGPPPAATPQHGFDRPGVDFAIPVVVRMRVECGRCGHTEDDTYEFDVPRPKAQPMEAYEPGKCPECGAPVQMQLKRWQEMR